MIDPETTVCPDAERSSSWRVEHIDEDGGIEVAIFAGPRAVERAKQFAAFMYGWTEND